MPDVELSKWTAVERNKVIAAVTKFGVPLLMKHGHPPEVSTALMQQFGQWTIRSGQMALQQRPDVHPLMFWELLAPHVPVLAIVAMAIYSMHPTEACVERSFSAQGLLYSELRSSLSDESINALMTIRMNVDRVFQIPQIERTKKRERPEEEALGSQGSDNSSSSWQI